MSDYTPPAGGQAGGPAPGGVGADKQVIFNDAGLLAGDAGMVYDKTTDVLTVGRLVVTDPSPMGFALTKYLANTPSAVNAVYDDFNDNVFDGAKWGRSSATDVIEQNARLEINAPGGFAQVDDALGYVDRRNHQWVVQVNPGSIVTYMRLYTQADGARFIDVRINPDLKLSIHDTSDSHYGISGAFSLASHNWLKLILRSDIQVVEVWTSGDANGEPAQWTMGWVQAIPGPLQTTTHRFSMIVVQPGLVSINSASVGPRETDFIKSNDVTLADIPGLSHNVVAGATYKYRVVLSVDGSAAGGIKVAMGGTALAVDTWRESYIRSGATISAGDHATGRAKPYGFTGAVQGDVIMEGFLRVRTAGTVTVQFAQNVSSINSSRVFTGSYFTLERIS